MMNKHFINNLDKSELVNFSHCLHDSIPVPVLEMSSKKLSASNKILYEVILTQITEYDYCIKSNKTLGKQVGIQSAVVSRYISKLVKMNLITAKYQFPNKQGKRVMYLSKANYNHIVNLDKQYRKHHGLRPAKLIKTKKHHYHKHPFHFSFHNHRHSHKIHFAHTTAKKPTIQSATSNAPSKAVHNNYQYKQNKDYFHALRQINKQNENMKKANLGCQAQKWGMTPNYQPSDYYKTNFGKPVRSKSDLTKDNKKVINDVAHTVHKFAPTYPVRIIKRTIVKEWVRKRAIIANLKLASIVTEYAKNINGEHIRAVIGFLCHISHQAIKTLKATVKNIKPKMKTYKLRQADLKEKQTDSSLDKYVF